MHVEKIGGWSLDHWRKSPVAQAIAEREGSCLRYNGGTPRKPRTAGKAARKENRKHGRYVCPLPDPEGVEYVLFRKLLAAGYYAEYRRAFEQADE